MRHVLPVPLASACLALALAACGPKPDVAPATTGTPAATPAPVVDAPAAPPPTTAPATLPASPIASPTYAGFGPAAFGSDAEAVRQAWGRPLDGEAPSAAPGEAEGCYLLTPQGAKTPGGPPALLFMIEGGKFVRTDVHGADLAAPGGGRVGMSTAEVERLYAGGIERQPHEYVEGAQYLRVRDAASGHVLVFETNAAGRVTTWRIGQVPQVDYVESCA